jgi:hypothetical protein
MGSIHLVTTSNLPSLARFAFSMKFQGLYSIRRAIPYTGFIYTQYPLLSKGLTHAVREAGALRKARSFHRNSSHAPPSRGRKNGKEKYESAFQWTNGPTVLARMEAVILETTRRYSATLSRHWCSRTSRCCSARSCSLIFTTLLLFAHSSTLPRPSTDSGIIRSPPLAPTLL